MSTIDSLNQSSEVQMDEPLQQKQVQAVYQKALMALSRREYSELQLKQYLLQKSSQSRRDNQSTAETYGEPGHQNASTMLEAVLEIVIKKLKQDNYLSNERFAQSLVSQSLRKGLGPVRIRQALRNAGIDERDFATFLNSETADWFALALQQRRKKFGLGQVAGYQEKAKQMRFLQGRGFEFEQIEYAVENTDTDME